MQDNYIVYSHINKNNGKAYIGITKRNPHIRWGNDGIGYKAQPKFYNAIQKYGWDSFEHIILNSNLTQEEALDLESYYIQQYNSIENGYNILSKGINSYPRNKPVYCLTTNTLYSSIKEAAESNQTTATRIIENCKGKNSGTKNLQWAYWDSFSNTYIQPKTFTSKPKQTTPIYCIELDKEFNSIAEACRELNLDKSGLLKVLNGTRNGIKGLHFVRTSEKDQAQERLQKQTGKYKQVYCVETDQIFNSVQEAAKFCNRSP